MKKTNNPKPSKLLMKDTYLQMIINASGSSLWLNNYGIVNGKKADLVANGSLSCAFFVTSILKMFDLIRNLHLTVEGTEKDLIKSGWQEIRISKNMPEGAILIWEKQKTLDSNTFHLHIGFYLGEEKAISNSEVNRFPIIHHYTYYNTRQIIKAYYHKKLDEVINL